MGGGMDEFIDRWLNKFGKKNYSEKVTA